MRYFCAADCYLLLSRLSSPAIYTSTHSSSKFSQLEFFHHLCDWFPLRKNQHPFLEPATFTCSSKVIFISIKWLLFTNPFLYNFPATKYNSCIEFLSFHVKIVIWVVVALTSIDISLCTFYLLIFGGFV